MFTTDPLRILWQRWWLPLAGAVLGLVLAATYLNIARYYYRAELRVTAADSSRTPTMANVVQSLSLSPIAALGLGSQSSATPFDIYLDALTSREVAAILARDGEVMRTIFPQQWDAASRRWREPQGFVPSLIRGVKDTLGIPSQPWRAPDAAALQDWLIQNLRVISSNKAPVTRVQLDLTRPELAQRALATLNEAADRKVRRDSLRQARTYSAFLTERLRLVQLAELRTRVADQLGRQEELIMMASSDVPFAAKPLEPPTVSRKPVRPAPALVLPLGVLGGLLAGALAALLLGARRGAGRAPTGVTLETPFVTSSAPAAEVTPFPRPSVG